jgi:hypothetical protein
MKIKLLWLMLFLGFLNNAMAQSSVLKIENAKHGNTARRGILPRDENGNFIEPTEQGHDFYTIETRVTKNSNVETVRLWLKSGEVLPLSINNNGTQQKVKKGESLFLTANTQKKIDPKTIRNAPKKIKDIALVEVKINKKTYFLPVAQMDEILPQ